MLYIRMMMKVVEKEKHMGFFIVVKIEPNILLCYGFVLACYKENEMLLIEERERERERACLSL